MTDAWEDIGAKRPTESYAEALARSLVGKTEAPKTEQEIAEKLVADRERMRAHDGYFADNFLSINEQQIISRTLAKQQGYHVGNDEPAGDGWAGTDD